MPFFTPRVFAVQYDGTNSAAIIDMIYAPEFGWDYTIRSEVGGVLTVAATYDGPWAINTGDWCTRADPAGGLGQIIPNARMVILYQPESP